MSPQELIEQCNIIIDMRDDETAYRNSIKTLPLQKIKRGKQQHGVDLVETTIFLIFVLTIKISIVVMLRQNETCVQETNALFIYQLIMVGVISLLYIIRIYIYRWKIVEWFHCVRIITGFCFASFASEICVFIWVCYMYGLQQCNNNAILFASYWIGLLWSLIGHLLSVQPRVYTQIAKFFETSPQSAPNLSELTPAEVKAHQSIQEYLDQEAIATRRSFGGCKKLLLLGTENSGQSTLFRESKSIRGWRFEQAELLELRHIIRQNIVLCIVQLLKKSDNLYKAEIIPKCVDLEIPKLMEYVQCIASFKNESFEHEQELDYNVMENLGNALDKIWNLEAIQLTYNRCVNFAIPKNIKYIFKKVTLIFREDYYPSRDDVLRTTICSNGIIVYKHEYNGAFLDIYDVSGQPNERKKWIHSFENMYCLIFVAALNHYRYVLFEDEQKNAMHASISFFDEIVNSEFFRQKRIILFLNNKDLFSECIREEISLSVCFSTNKGWTRNEWEEKNDYQPIYDDEEIDNNLFQKCYEAALDFIQNAYLSSNKNTHYKSGISVHVTDGMDSQIEEIFFDVQNIVIKSNLGNGGFF
eukprot:190039_1